MPTLQQIYRLDITPEKFIDNCSDIELQEVILLANSRLNRMETTPEPPTANCQRPTANCQRPTANYQLPPADCQRPTANGQRPATKTPQPPPKKTAARTRGWTPEEDEIIRKMWPTHLGVEIADKLHREYKSVMARASKLGLKKRYRNPEPELPPPPVEIPPSNKKTTQRNTDCIGVEINHGKK